MAGKKVRVDQMADAIMQGLTEYADLATDEMKSAVKKAGKTVKDEIKANAPKDTGRYASSWTTKTTQESATLGLRPPRWKVLNITKTASWTNPRCYGYPPANTLTRDTM